MCLPAVLCVSCSLADTLWTCAMLDEQPSTAWLLAFTSSSQQHLRALSSSSLVNLVWSLALVQHRPPSDWTIGCLEALSHTFAATAAAVAGAVPAGPDSPQEPLSPAQLVRVSWALAALDCQLPGAFSAQLLQLCMQCAPHLDADSLAQLVWAWDRLDATPDKQHVRQIAAAVRSQLMPGVYSSLMGGVLQGSYSSASTRAGHGPGDTSALQRPVAKVRVGQQRVVVRSNGGSSGAGQVVVLAQQQQQQVRGVQEGAALAAVPAGFVPQRGLLVGGGRVQKLGTKQQLMATLQKIYAADLNLKPGSSSGSGGAADAAELTAV